jgi:hypothetical protein
MRQRDSEARTNERLLTMGKEEKASLWLQAREAQQQQQPTTNERLLTMGKEEKASLWLQAREAQQKQQPTTNERLLAASALPVAASKRSTTAATTYNQ